jgi:hypothetical protein
MDWLVLGGIFLGCLARTLIPWLKKRKEAAKTGEAIKFDNSFLITLALGLAVSMTTAMLVYPQFVLAEGVAFPAAFIFGYGAQDLTNGLVT